jgi:hypothetical protein
MKQKYKNIIAKSNILFVFALCLLLTSCGIYSFTGASIPPGAKTLSIGYFNNRAPTVQPTLSSVFTDKLKDYFTSQSNLDLVDGEADVEISGYIVNYNVAPASLQSNDQVALDRLTITIQVKCVNKLEPKFNFSQNFSRYKDYDARVSLMSVESGLIEEISTELVEDIYQKAFVNW